MSQSHQSSFDRLRTLRRRTLSEVEVQVTSHKLKGLIFILSGPSGSGKTTLLKNLLRHKALKNKLARSISFTTRPKRSGEEDKKDYFFITEERFKREQKSKKILEWTKYLGFYYATPKRVIEREINKNKHVILCLDLKGAQKIKRLYPKNTIMIFVMPPSQEALLGRITSRCNKTKAEEIKDRLRLAQQEMLAAGRYDYCLVNKDLSEAIKQLKEIMLKKIKGFG